MYLTCDGTLGFNLNCNLNLCLESGYRQLFLNSRPSTAQPRVKSAGQLRLTKLLEQQTTQVLQDSSATTATDDRSGATSALISHPTATEEDAEVTKVRTCDNFHGINHDSVALGVTQRSAHRTLAASAPPMRTLQASSNIRTPPSEDKQMLHDDKSTAQPSHSVHNLNMQMSQTQLSTTALAVPQQMTKRESFMLVTPSFWHKKSSQLLRRPLEGRRHFRMMLELEKLPEESHALLPMLDHTFVTVSRGNSSAEREFYTSHYPLLLSVVPVWKANADTNKEDERVPFFSRSKTFLKVADEIMDPHL